MTRKKAISPQSKRPRHLRENNRGRNAKAGKSAEIKLTYINQSALHINTASASQINQQQKSWHQKCPYERKSKKPRRNTKISNLTIEIINDEKSIEAEGNISESHPPHTSSPANRNGTKLHIREKSA